MKPSAAQFKQFPRIRRAPRLRFRLCALALAAAGVLAYAPSWFHPFVWDDEYLITSNRGIAGLASPWLAITPEFSQKVFDRHAGFFRPVTSLSLLFDYRLWGVSPMGYHVMNTLLYGLCVGATVLFIRRLTGREGLALMTGLLFLVFGAHTEAVLWVKCRAEMLAYLGVIGSLGCFLNAAADEGAPGKRRLWGPASIVSFFLALGAKIHAVVLPALAGLAVCWTDGNSRMTRRSLLKTWPFWIALAGAGVFVYATSDGGHRAAGEDNESRALAGLSVFQRMGESTLAYTRIALWPGELRVVHEAPGPQGMGNAAALVIMAIACIACVFLLIRGRRGGWAAFGVLWFALALAPMINIISIDGRWLAEQRLFLPSLGVCLALAALVERVALPADGLRRPWRVAIAAMLLVALCLAHAVPALRSMSAWRSEDAFWTEILRTQPDFVTARDRLGVYLARNGQPERGLEHLNKAKEISPGDIYVRLHLGIVHDLVGDATRAVATLDEVVRMRPDLPEARSSLAKVLLRAGRAERALAEAGAALDLDPRLAEARRIAVEALVILERWKEAESMAEQLAALEPWNPEAQAAVARIMRMSGDFARAQIRLKELNSQFPESAAVRAEAAALAYDQGRHGEAAALLKALLAIERRADWHNLLGKCLLLSGRTPEAVMEYANAVQLGPGHAGYHADLAEALLVSNQVIESASHYRIALRQNPRDGSGWSGLGICLARQGDIDGALDAFNRAVEIEPENADLWRNRGRAQMQAGQIAQAIASLKTSLDLDDSAPDSWLLLSQAYVASGSMELAQKSRLKANDRNNNKESSP